MLWKGILWQQKKESTFRGKYPFSISGSVLAVVSGSSIGSILKWFQEDQEAQGIEIWDIDKEEDGLDEV